MDDVSSETSFDWKINFINIVWFIKPTTIIVLK